MGSEFQSQNEDILLMSTNLNDTTSVDTTVMQQQPNRDVRPYTMMEQPRSSGVRLDKTKKNEGK